MKIWNQHGLNTCVGTAEFTKNSWDSLGKDLVTHENHWTPDTVQTAALNRHPHPAYGTRGTGSWDDLPGLLRGPWGSSSCSPGQAELSYCFLPQQHVILPKSSTYFPICYSGTCWQWHRQKLISYCWAKQISLIMTQGVQYFISLSLTLSPSLWV